MSLLIIVRPEPGSGTTLAEARVRGLEAVSYPLFDVQPVSWDAPAPDDFDALLLGSANALRHGGVGLELYRGKPAYAVGHATALAADAAGLDVLATGSGGLQALFGELAPGHRRLLRLTGRARIALSPPAGIDLIERVVYDSAAVPMPLDLGRLLTTRALAGAVVLLHSAEAARHFAGECDRLGVPRARLRLVALGPRIAAAAGDGWMEVACAETPDETALLALAAQLCQNPPSRPNPSEIRMPDDAWSQSGLPQPVRAQERRVWIVAAGAFILGAGVAGWLGWQSGADFGAYVGRPRGSAASDAGTVHPSYASSPMPANAAPDQIALAGRIAAVEQRLDRIDQREAVASGNAARAEALLVAFAARRVVERGAPLGYLSDQLKLRFGDAQPHAVATIITGTKDLVPLNELAARLEELAPRLSAAGQPTLWRRVTRELSDLFVVRRDRPVLSSADIRLDDARKAVSEGRIDDAVADVGQLSNSADAATWSAAARHYRDVERALDLIDTTALLEPHQLRDAGGIPINPVLR